MAMQWSGDEVFRRTRCGERVLAQLRQVMLDCPANLQPTNLELTARGQAMVERHRLGLRCGDYAAYLEQHVAPFLTDLASNSNLPVWGFDHARASLEDLAQVVARLQDLRSYLLDVEV